MAKSYGFPPVARPDALVLILGTLPGAESLKQSRYYANKQNSFWRIMGEIAGANPELPYEERLACLKRSRIALWDVCRSAEREGSLDSNILAPEPNDFAAFFAAHPLIGSVCFNGQGAAKLFARLVKPILPTENRTYAVLPSTSPAHAGMRFEEKSKIWQQMIGRLMA